MVRTQAEVDASRVIGATYSFIPFLLLLALAAIRYQVTKHAITKFKMVTIFSVLSLVSTSVDAAMFLLLVGLGGVSKFLGYLASFLFPTLLALVLQLAHAIVGDTSAA